jgi:hypothetical protein
MACEALELRSTSRLPIKSNKKIRVKLEKECTRNIELQWLLCGIIPNYHSISDFRKQNPSGLKNLFKLFVSFLKDVDLIAGETIAIDGTKSRAYNVKNSFFSKAKYCEKLKERSPENYTKVKKQLWEKQWVVFAKKPFGSPKSVVEYLGRYTHKIATCLPAGRLATTASKVLTIKT